MTRRRTPSLATALLLTITACTTHTPSSPAVQAAPSPAAPTVRTDERTVIDQHDLVRITPPNPIGAVFLFHGYGGYVDAWLRRSDMNAVVEALVADGWMVLILGAPASQQHAWDVFSVDSPDVAVVKKLLPTLPPGRPVHAVGHSQGGSMAILAGAVAQMASVVVVHGVGVPRLHETLPLPPTLFIAGQNDTIVPAEKVRLGFETAQRSGAEAAWSLSLPTPLQAHSLALAAEVDETTAVAALAAARAAGLTDAADVPVVHPVLNRVRWEAALLPVLGSLGREQAVAVRDRLLVAYAEHALGVSELPPIRAWLASHPKR